MYGKSVPEIVHARLVDRAIVAGDASNSAKPLKRFTQDTLVQSIALLVQKKLGCIHCASSMITDVISPQQFA